MMQQLSFRIFFWFLFLNNSFSVYGKEDVAPIISVKDFGAKGNGKTDDTKSIQRALDYIANIGGGQVNIPTSNGDYLISETLFIGSDTKIVFQNSYLKLIRYTKVGTLLFNKPNATNITLISPKLDGNNIYAGGTGENGISFGNGGVMIVNGGIIKNFKKGISHNKLGGKGVQVENKNVKSFQMSGTSILNCSIALSSQFDIAENARSNSSINVSFDKIYAENCGIFLLLIQVNGLVESDSRHNVSLTNFKTYNCGAEESVFVFSRARSFRVINGIVSGTRKVDAIIRGRHSRARFDKVTINQQAHSLVNLEPSFHGLASTKSENNFYNIIVNKDIEYLLRTSPNSKYKYRELFNSDMRIKLSNKGQKKLLMPQAIYSNSNVTITGGDGKILLDGNMIELYKRGKIK